mmetsp:Transcript_22697/g.62660  ORF Transcript_22697/g.62660 Transcript_22697/m.62660 type:complete len:141 (+) Transcript_22697:1875-2297(+)
MPFPIHIMPTPLCSSHPPCQLQGVVVIKALPMKGCFALVHALSKLVYRQASSSTHGALQAPCLPLQRGAIIGLEDQLWLVCWYDLGRQAGPAPPVAPPAVLYLGMAAPSLLASQTSVLLIPAVGVLPMPPPATKCFVCVL